jgi:FKBP-type peptidyl-prolyl cis-trans isomerase FkpA
MKMTRPLMGLTVVVALAMAGYGSWAVQHLAPPSGPLQAAAQVGPAVDLLAEAAKAPGAEVLPSGLVYRAVSEGTGRQPRATDSVRVHYRGTLANGQEFDNSHGRGEPAEFPLNKVIACWTEGLQKMKAGGKAVLTCPAPLAYGERGAGAAVPPNATLQFEVELLAVLF